MRRTGMRRRETEGVLVRERERGRDEAKAGEYMISEMKGTTGFAGEEMKREWRDVLLGSKVYYRSELRQENGLVVNV